MSPSGNVAQDRREALALQRAVGVRDQGVALFHRQLIHMKDQFFERLVLPEQLGRALFADAGNAGKIVAGVALDALEVGDLRRVQTVTIAHGLCVVDHGVGDALDHHHDLDGAMVVVHQLQRVAVAGDDQHFIALIFGDLGERADGVVGLHALDLDHGDVERFRRVAGGLALGLEVVGNGLALGLVARQLFVAKRGRRMVEGGEDRRRAFRAPKSSAASSRRRRRHWWASGPTWRDSASRRSPDRAGCWRPESQVSAFSELYPQWRHALIVRHLVRFNTTPWRNSISKRPIWIGVHAMRMNARKYLLKSMKMPLQFCAILALAAQTAIGAHAAPTWSEAKANDWYKQQPWLVGSNYTPSTAINELEMWQSDTFDPKTIDRELGWAQEIGMNTMRVFLQDQLWTQDRQGFKTRLDRVSTRSRTSTKSSRYSFSFDSCWDPFPKLGKQHDPIPGIHNSGWVQSPGAEELQDTKQYPQTSRLCDGCRRRLRPRSAGCWAGTSGMSRGQRQ